MYLLCHVTSQDHVIKGLYYFIGGSSFWYVNTLPSLVTICDSRDMFLICHVIPRNYLFKL